MSIQELKQQMTISRTLLREYTSTHQGLLIASRSSDRNEQIDYARRMQAALQAWRREFDRYRSLIDRYREALKRSPEWASMS